jgi:hypothetical protein
MGKIPRRAANHQVASSVEKFCGMDDSMRGCHAPCLAKKAPCEKIE